ncbi:unnamed protein product [Caenorhabditis angaria]|uniref:EB domain-containing protein n=1 Tax=Caenorhabditis angaria TaxID=860376 RepID=A0A9P1ITN8_9PELO|nr:unnamed protein product [Caenorhabditis angaria]
MNIFIIFCLFFGFTVGYAGRACTHSLQCERGTFCNEGACRKDTCSSDSNCEAGEECRPGNVNGRQKSGCFLVTTISTSADYCPGGALVLSSLGSITQCDLSSQCPSTHICNPIHGVCCTKLPTCPKTRKTMLNFITGKPIMCQFKNGRIMPCPESGYCEQTTGFCCGNQEIPEVPKSNKGLEKLSEKPWRGEICQPVTGCSGGAACICGGRGGTLCKCECSGEFGYTVAADGKTCQRVRRRLKEKCRTDMECSAAFSECSSGGCRCKRGFKRNGDGGCEPIEYRCVNKGTVLKKNEKIVTCHLKHTTLRSVFKSLKVTKTNETDDETFEKLMKGITLDLANNETMFDSSSISDRDDCPSDHYCVPVFDDSSRPGYYQGFCCPSPTEIRPTCPVGEAHESSYPPDYGCSNCPGDYYCHRDAVSTEKTICCPKPCVSLEDIYHEGQCYSTAYYGDSCHISAQCSYSKSIDHSEEYAEISKLECLKNICSCPAGFSFADGTCKRIMCSIGLRGEPSVDKSGQLIRCGRSSDCSMGHMCDPNTHVCCKGTNRCPKDYVETGELCTDDNCRGVNEICEWTKNGKTKICCTYDDEYSLLQYPSDNLNSSSTISVF